jgi:hypothetical protein
MAKKKLNDMTLEEQKQILQSLARGIQNQCLLMGIEDPLFALVIFNDPKQCKLASNCSYAHVKQALQSTIDTINRHQSR